VLDDLDLVLVMSVNPGFGGQAFIPGAHRKIREVKALLGDRPVEVSVDGGVKADLARSLVQDGATTLVRARDLRRRRPGAAVRRCAMPRVSRGAPEVVDALAHRGEFFRVLQQTERSQTAVMTLARARMGARRRSTRAIRSCTSSRGGDSNDRRAEHRVGPGALVLIPAGTRHHVRNPGRTPLFFVTVYAPPNTERSRSGGAAVLAYFRRNSAGSWTHW